MGQPPAKQSKPKVQVGERGRSETQKKAFTRWCNQQLREAGETTIEDPFVDLRDGMRVHGVDVLRACV